MLFSLFNQMRKYVMLQWFLGMLFFVVLATGVIYNRWYISEDIMGHSSKIDSYEHVQDLLASLTSEDVCIFDIDKTLVYPTDQAVQHIKTDALRRAVFEKQPELINPRETEKNLSLIMAQAPRDLVEPDIREIINDLKARDVHTIGLTKLMTGSYGKLPRLEVWCYDMLKKLGINFQREDVPEDLVFTTFVPFKHNHVRYYKGILFTHDKSKSEVLAAYLDALALTPKRIVFFDNKYKNILAINELCKRRGIEAHCFWYKGADKKYSPTLDIKRAVFQVDQLVKHDVWMSDEEASNAMQNSKFTTAADFARQKKMYKIPVTY